MVTKLPTLTTSGWIEDVASVATALMDYFLVSENSQSQFFNGHVTSLPHLIQKYGSEPGVLVEEAQSRLRGYFSRYFEVVMVNVDSDKLSQGRYNLRLDIMVGNDQQQESLGRLIEISDSKIIEVRNTNDS